MNDFSDIHVVSQISCYCPQDGAQCSHKLYVPWLSHNTAARDTGL